MDKVFLLLLVFKLVLCIYLTQSTTLIRKSDGRHFLRYVARVMYDGTRFKGFQDLTKSKIDETGLPLYSNSHPPNTVQGILKKALSERFSTKISVIGASRTDTGVHSRGQAIHFDVEKPIENIQNFEFTMNRVLPDDIRIYNVTLAPSGTPEQTLDNELWHATKSSIGKLYSYTFCTNKYVDPMLRKYCGHMYFPVDIQLLEKSLKLFEGTHDFSAFSNQVDRKRIEFANKNMSYSTIKTIYSIDLIPLNDYGSLTNLNSNSFHRSSKGPNHLYDHNSNSGYYRIDIYLNSALYRMVRNIVWACAYTAAGMMKFEDLQSLINPEIPYYPIVPSAPPPVSPSLIHTVLLKKNKNDAIINKIVNNGMRNENNNNNNMNTNRLQYNNIEIEGRGLCNTDAIILPIRCKNIAKPAPPEGLCLERVLYHHY